MKGEMRRSEKEITDIEEINRILGSTQYITMAMCENNRPYLVTLSHGFDAERNCLYFHCASAGKKIDILKSNSQVWGQAIMDMGYSDGQCDHLFVSVHFEGQVIFLENITEKKQALGVMIKQLEKNPDRVMSELLGEDALKKVIVGKIEIERVYAKKSEKVVVSL